MVWAIVNVHQESDAVITDDRFEFRATQGPHTVCKSNHQQRTKVVKKQLKGNELCDQQCNLKMLQLES